MERIKTLETRNLCESAKNGGRLRRMPDLMPVCL